MALARNLAGAAVLMTCLGLAGPLAAQDGKVPAELPPPDYLGQQYVDSRGCLFARAGHAGKTVWVPRVTRAGVPQCGYPPSGKRVGADGEAGAAVDGSGLAAASLPVTPPPEGGYLVAVGSFGVSANADRAAARLKALGYTARMEQGKGALMTVFAGPFASAAAAAEAQARLRADGFPDATVLKR